MKKINFLLVALLVMLYSLQTTAQTCTQDFAALGVDDDPTSVTVNAADITCQGTGTVTSITLTNSQGSLLPAEDCGSDDDGGLFTFNLIIDGTTVVSLGCSGDLDGTDIPVGFNTFTLESVDSDGSGDDVKFTFDLSIAYTANPCTGTTTTWNGAWDNGAPTATTPAVFTANYKTSDHGNITTCSCTVEAGARLVVDSGSSTIEETLTIMGSGRVTVQSSATLTAKKTELNDGRVYTKSGGVFTVGEDLDIAAAGRMYIKSNSSISIENNIVNEGILDISSSGSLVQVSSAATVTGAGTFTLNKTTTPYKEYDYTYFSSPSSTATVANAFVSAGSNSGYIWTLATANFDDASGDGYDDNQDDWAHASGNLTPGVGYAVLGSSADFPFDGTSMSGSTNVDTIKFEGAFNTGDISVTLVADANTGDGFDNQNLIGNPYPCAIDAKAFWRHNDPALGNTFYFWTHNTQLAAGGSGGYAYNFTNDDYSTWVTGTGGVASASGGAAPSDYIASGQAFLAEAANPGTITFTNAMRVTGENDSFIKASGEEHDKVWLNMVGDNEDFRQILVAFIDEATDAYDTHFDAKRIENGNNTDFYSVIGGSDTHYAIQAAGTFNVNKVIPLGLEITQAGNYSIAVDHFEGIFATSGQDIYIYDNYTNTYHNIATGGPFTFTTATGAAINDRLEVRFTTNTKNAMDIEDGKLTYAAVYPNPSNDIFNISWRGDTTAQIQVLDLSGKQILATNKIQSQNRTYQLDMSDFEKGIYFVRLSVNGHQIIKKLILN